MVALLATVGYACETIDEDDRFIGPIEGVTPQDSTSEDSILIIEKNVLIEDFTGQRCLNCPNASKTIHEMQNAFGKDRIIAVAIHGGFLSIPAPAGLANPESDAYNTKWNVSSWPKGMVSRKGGLLEPSSWSAAAMPMLKENALVDIKADKSTYNEETRTLNVNVDLTAIENLEATLQIWLVENDIIAYQMMPDGSHNTKYVHNHVFRSSVNGTNGENVSLTKEETWSKQYEYTITEKTWKPENMAIVTFVANESGVLQVIQTPIAK